MAVVAVELSAAAVVTEETSDGIRSEEKRQCVSTDKTLSHSSRVLANPDTTNGRDGNRSDKAARTRRPRTRVSIRAARSRVAKTRIEATGPR